MKNQKGFTVVEVVFVIVLLVGAMGWLTNLYKLTQCDFEPSYKAEVLRGIGILPPIGAIMGYIPIEDKKATN